MTNTTLSSRTVARVFTAPAASDGDGVELHRAFPGRALMDIDPFLLLDELGPTALEPGEARGFPEHPHRGFETVTYLLSGEMQHRDSWGNHGVLRPGDVQWMTAGSGLVHSELPGESLVREGGTLHGFQLWINLPRKDKMIPPRYQDTPGERIPVAHGSGVEAKVIAGEALGTQGVIDTRIPILYLHLTLQPGTEFDHRMPQTANAFAYVIEGEASFGGASAGAHQVAIFARDGETVRISNPSSAAGPLSLLLLAGEPLGEPVARYGPFVMNTQQELRQAAEDYREGRMGTIGRT